MAAILVCKISYNGMECSLQNYSELESIGLHGKKKRIHIILEGVAVCEGVKVWVKTSLILQQPICIFLQWIGIALKIGFF